MSKIYIFLTTFIIFTFFSATVRSQHTSLLNATASAPRPCGPVASAAVHCPVSCFRTDPVCGADGVTYWCGCADAECAGAQVAKLGFCDIGDGANGTISGQALLLVHIVWLILLGFFVVFGHL